MRSWKSSRRHAATRFAGLLIALSLGNAQPVAAAIDVWTANGPFVAESVGSPRRLAVDPQTPSILYAGANVAVDCGASVSKSTNGGASWQNVLAAIDCVDAIVVDRVDPRVVHVAVDSGFHTSTDGGISWEAKVLPGLESGEHLTALAIDPTRTATLYAGTSTRCSNQYDCSGRLLKSADSGRSWSAAASYDTAVNAVAIGADATVYVAGGLGYSDSTADPTARPGFLLRSIDDGTTWVDVDPMPGAFALQLALVPTGGRLHAATSVGLFGSDDRGESWQTEPARLPVDQLSVDPLDPRSVYAIGNRGASGIYSTELQHSSDGGASWTVVHGPPESADGFSPGALLVAPTQPPMLYAAFVRQLYRTSDQGATWTAAGLGLGSVVAGRLAIDPSDGALHVTAGTVFRSADHATTWSPRGETLQFLYDIAFDPAHPATIYVTSFDGVRKSIDGGRSWHSINLGLFTSTTGAIAVDPAAPNVLYLAAGALYTSNDAGDSWTAASNGLPSDLDARAVLVTDGTVTDGTVYVGAFPGLYASSDRGRTWRTLGVDSVGIRFVTDLAADPHHPERLYAAGFEGLAGSVDAGATWTHLTAGTLLDGQTCTTVAVSPVDSSLLYVGTYSGAFRSRDGGATWQAFSPGLTQNVVGDLLIEPSDPRIVYAATEFSGVYAIEQSDVSVPATPTPRGITPLDTGGCTLGITPPGRVATVLACLFLAFLLCRSGRSTT